MSNSDLDSFGSFVAVWKEAFAKILTQLGAASVVVKEPGPDTGVQTNAEDADSVHAIFAGGGCLAGRLQLSAAKTAAVQLAQLLMAAPIDPAAAFTETDADGFCELLRQVAGEVSLVWKEAKGAPAELLFQTEAKERAASQRSIALSIASDKINDLVLRIDADAEMERSLGADQNVDQQSVSSEDSGAEAAQPSALPANVELLLDVQLDATIRFGEREMLLQDVFGLMPGAVVELDQLVNEPAELLVAGRVVAKGEVVVVDGNFGLRVTEVASAAQRAAALSLA
ncbi:MAG TPA: FliM/FliN family flagellar motor switch protein [Dongiaceae bacterium]|nr:FliM/FliN family flagellar motor switch protein [Dongiaceae bacterium]